MSLEREGFVLDMIKVQYIPTNQVGATNKYNISTAGRTVPQYKHRISSVLLLSSQVLSCLHVQPTTPKQRHAWIQALKCVSVRICGHGHVKGSKEPHVLVIMPNISL